MRKPGPAHVVAFAKDVEKKCTGDSTRESGLRTAMAWVMGNNRSHPVTGQQTPTPDYPPNFPLIERAEQQARRAHRRRQPKPHKDYVEAVWDCLAWINGHRSKKPRL